MKQQTMLAALLCWVSFSVYGVDFPVIIEATDHAILSAPRDGMLNGKMTDVGKEVKKGHVIASLNTKELSLELSKSRSEYGYYKKMEDQFQRLIRTGLKTIEEVGLKRLEKNKALAEINIAKSRIARSSVKAPYGGYVVKRLLQPHEWASAGTPIVEFVNNDQLFVIANLPADYLNKIKLGDEHSIHVEAIDITFTANVSVITPIIDVKSNTFEVRWLVSNPDKILFHGMRGRVVL